MRTLRSHHVHRRLINFPNIILSCWYNFQNKLQPHNIKLAQQVSLVRYFNQTNKISTIQIVNTSKKDSPIGKSFLFSKLSNYVVATNLFCTKQSVASIAKTRQNVAVLVKLSVLCCAVDLYVRVSIVQCFDSFWCSDDVHTLDVFYAFSFK